MALGFSCVLVLKSLACRPLSSSLLYHGCQMTAQAPGSHSCCRWEEEGRSRHLLLIRFCLLTLEEKPGTCIFISVVGIVIVWAPGPVREAGKSSILATVLYKRGRQKAVVTGFWEANAVCCPECKCMNNGVSKDRLEGHRTIDLQRQKFRFKNLWFKILFLVIPWWSSG